MVGHTHDLRISKDLKKYNIKTANYKEKNLINWITFILRTSVHKKALLKEQKGKKHTVEKVFATGTFDKTLLSKI